MILNIETIKYSTEDFIKITILKIEISLYNHFKILQIGIKII